MPVTGNVIEADNSVIIKVAGRFDYQSHREFRSCFEGHDPHATYIVDLGKTEYMDSSALGMLLVLREYAGGDSAKITIRGVEGAIKQILDIARFAELFDLRVR